MTDEESAITTLAHVWCQGHACKVSEYGKNQQEYWQGFLDAIAVGITIVSGLPPHGIDLTEAIAFGEQLAQARQLDFGDG